MTDLDFAVIGAGIAGTVAARELARREPAARIAVFDRDLAGSGASRRSAGLHFPRGRTPRVREMTRYSQSYYRQLVREHPAAPIHPLEMLVVASREHAGDLAELYLPEAELEPATGPLPEGVALPGGAALWSGQGCQYAEVAALTQLLAASLRERVAFREAVRVTALEPGPDAVLLRLGTGEELAAGRVLLAPGPWLADPAWARLTALLGARVKKVVALHVDAVPGPKDPAVVFQDEDAFLLPLYERGHWLFSYTCTEWDVDPDRLADGLRAADLAAAREVLGRYSPALAGRCTAGRVFCDAYSPSGEPLARPLDAAGRLVFAGAANGSGYRLAPALAAAAADLLRAAPAPAVSSRS